MHVFSGLQGRSVLVVEGEAWHGKRTALQPAFAPRPVQSLVPTIVAACDKALAQWPTRAPAWPVESALTGLAMDIIMQTLFSSGIGDDARLAEHAVHAAPTRRWSPPTRSSTGRQAGPTGCPGNDASETP